MYPLGRHQLLNGPQQPVKGHGQSDLKPPQVQGTNLNGKVESKVEPGQEARRSTHEQHPGPREDQSTGIIIEYLQELAKERRAPRRAVLMKKLHTRGEGLAGSRQQSPY
ncbi:hypothetical protein Y1Q_0018898 [Alligator mississippiensis]|uniref:Uncharacterized protein n=1 Tax=Alligator mississippiensis TaxID=8496 RepID=A0A151M339_ALLMI|nr:hypothetical protein Y1Q_0018898 [Alligator mississippiensis]